MFDFLVMAQCEHKRLGVTLTDSQQKQPVRQNKTVLNTNLTSFYRSNVRV